MNSDIGDVRAGVLAFVALDTVWFKLVEIDVP